jgi:dTDP-4-dehydrorhamnose 3,5-epimerase
MKIVSTPIDGLFVIEPVLHRDDRGFFARCWDRDALMDAGLDTDLHISAITFNHHAGTLRGMHYQKEPFAETKIVRVTRGAIFDVAIDLRKSSATYQKWFGVELSARNYRQFYIPKGFAHGYLTLEPDTELAYFLSAPYAPDHAAGVRWDDPAFAIDWPGKVNVIAPRDAGYADHQP